MHYYILEDITDETLFANINASGLVLKFHIAIEIVSFSSPQCSIGLRSRKTHPETDIGTKSQFVHFAKCKCMVNTSICFALFNYILGIWWFFFHDKWHNPFFLSMGLKTEVWWWSTNGWWSSTNCTKTWVKFPFQMYEMKIMTQALTFAASPWLDIRK